MDKDLLNPNQEIKDPLLEVLELNQIIPALITEDMNIVQNIVLKDREIGLEISLISIRIGKRINKERVKLNLMDKEMEELSVDPEWALHLEKPEDNGKVELEIDWNMMNRIEIEVMIEEEKGEKNGVKMKVERNKNIEGDILNRKV